MHRLSTSGARIPLLRVGCRLIAKRVNDKFSIGNPSLLSQHCLLSTSSQGPSPSSSSSSSPSSSSSQPAASPENENYENTNNSKKGIGKLLYVGNNEMIVTGMFSMTWLNLFYWSYVVMGNAGVIGQQYQGLDLGSPIFGYIGLACTGLIAFSTRLFAHQHVYKVYESADGDNLLFQTHNLLGGGGRYILARPSRVRFAKVGEVGSLSSTTIPVKIDDMPMNFVLYQTSKYYESNKLLAILERSTEQVEKKMGIQKHTIRELLDEAPVGREATMQSTPFNRKAAAR